MHFRVARCLLVAPGLLLHKFVKADSWRGALTTDASGDNLPLHGSVWIYAKEVVVSPADRRVGATSLQITRGISERGYFLFPISDDCLAGFLRQRSDSG
jgi:hypothetical protein